MAIDPRYNALVAAWNSGTQPPTGVTGTALTGLTTANKLIAINGWTVPAVRKAILNPCEILNAIVPADLNALTVAQLTLFTLLLQGSQIDASAGTAIRACVTSNLFVGKTQTIANLTALVAPFDNATLPWWQATVAQNGGGLSCPISSGDLALAGGLT